MLVRENFSLVSQSPEGSKTIDQTKVFILLFWLASQRYSGIFHIVSWEREERQIDQVIT